MFKFFGEPLKEVKSRLSGKILFRFDTNGEFVTEDNAIVERARGNFDHIEMKAETVGKRVNKTHKVEALTITTREVV